MCACITFLLNVHGQTLTFKSSEMSSLGYLIQATRVCNQRALYYLAPLKHPGLGRNNRKYPWTQVIRYKIISSSSRIISSWEALESRLENFTIGFSDRQVKSYESLPSYPSTGILGQCFHSAKHHRTRVKEKTIKHRKR